MAKVQPRHRRAGVADLEPLTRHCRRAYARREVVPPRNDPVRGALFVTPPPGDEHETIAAKLGCVLDPYVHANGLGLVYRPHAVMRYDESEVEPDIMVRQQHPNRTKTDKDWGTASIPTLVVEILSAYTRRRALNQKRQLYLDAGVAEYWLVDTENRTITIITPRPRRTEDETVVWHPAGTDTPLQVELASIF